MTVRGRWRRYLIVCSLVLGLMAAPAAAQDTGTVSGTVIDAQGASIPGATITLIEERTGATRLPVTVPSRPSMKMSSRKT